MYRSIKLLAVLLFVSRFGSQAEGRQFTLEVEVPAVSFDVSVVDQRGRPVKDLRPGDFEVLENGIPQQIRYFGESAQPNPYHVYLLFDSSGSTSNQWDLLENAVRGFVELAKPEDRLSAGTFGSFLRPLDDWEGPDETRVTERLVPEEQHVESGRSTQFYRAVGEAISQVYGQIAERRALVVLTDGRDSALFRETLRRGRALPSSEDFAYLELYEMARSSQVPVYFIAINTDRNLAFNQDGTDEYKQLRNLFRNSSVSHDYLRQVRYRMEQIAEASGGQVLFPENIGDVMRFAAEIGKSLSDGYSLGYIPGPAKPGEGVRRISVHVRGHGRLRIRYSQHEYDPR